MATQIHGAGPAGQRSPGLDLAIAGYLVENPPAGGGGASALDDLTDVDTTGQTTGDVLKYNGTSWVADAASAGTVTSTDISDSTAVGRDVLTAADAATARTAIGAGTSSFDGAYSSLSGAPDLGDYVRVVEHGTDPNVTRPAGATVVLWIGSVEPTNAVAGDQWDDASGSPSNYYTESEVDALLADKADVTQAINAQTGTTYTAVSGDVGKLTTLTNASPIALTIATLPAGSRLDFRQGGAGAVTVAGSGVTLRAMPGMTLVSGGQYARFSVDFVTSTEADVIGWMVPA